MTDKEYDTMMKNLNELVWEATDVVNTYKNYGYFKTLPEVKRASLINKAAFIKPRQTRILQTEMYHILSMGDMSLGQELVFSRLTRALMNTRPYIEYISGLSLRDEDNISMKVNKEYNCTSLGITVRKAVVGQDA